MQLCALGKNEELIRASSAERHIDYSCLECGQVVRLRKGAYRQAHFYHSQPNHSCRLSGKGLVHLSVQNRIVELLPPGEAEMEYRFSEIRRIADVVWMPQKIVFEIQCATITAEEVMGRNSSYASIGFDVVWILHDNRYNKVRMTSAEDVLSNYTHYYTDIDTHGKGMIYDHYAHVVAGKRAWQFPPLPVDVIRPFHPVPAMDHLHEQQFLPVAFLERYANWSRGFAGDYLDMALKVHGDEHEISLLQSELLACFERLAAECSPKDTAVVDYVRRFVFRWIVHPYQVLLRHFLEKASR